MAPISENLHDLVEKLEARVKDLENRLHIASGDAKSKINTADGIRMILMGPPGAGTTSNPHFCKAVGYLGTCADV